MAGFIAAALCAVYFYASLALDINPLGGSKAFGYIIIVAVFILALWHFRKTYLNSEMHFHQAFFLSFLMNFVSCLVFAGFVGFYLKFLNPELLARHIAESKLFFASIREDFVKTNSLKAYQISLASLDKMTVSDIMWDEFKKRFLILLFFVLLVSFMMRRSPDWASSK